MNRSEHQSEPQSEPDSRDTATDATTDGEWVHVLTKRDLPSVNTSIECKFPSHDHSIKCKVLSRAGKASTANWHFMNILEENAANGKCCSFKNVSWKLLSDN